MIDITAETLELGKAGLFGPGQSCAKMDGADCLGTRTAGSRIEEDIVNVLESQVAVVTGAARGAASPDGTRAG